MDISDFEYEYLRIGGINCFNGSFEESKIIFILMDEKRAFKYKVCHIIVDRMNIITFNN